MKRRRQAIRGCEYGLTLIEVAISMLLASVVITTMLSVRYYTVKHAKRADVYNNAERLALLLLESWRSVPTPATYDPVASFSGELSISTSASGPSPALGFTVLGQYHVVMHSLHYYATLAYQPATVDDPAVLNVCVGWKKHYVEGLFTSEDEYVRLTSYD